MIDDFMLRAGLAGLSLASAAGVLGCFVVWRRMAYFGDALAHSSILGVAIALGFGASMLSGVLLVAISLAVMLYWLSQKGLGVDTLLGVLSHGALAIGLLVASLQTGIIFSLEAVLFGDILALSWADVALTAAGCAAVLAVLLVRWDKFIAAVLNPELAASIGVSASREMLVVMLVLAVFIALAIKAVGALMVSAFLIIPAASARQISKTPEQMAVFAVVIGAFSCVLGLILAYYYDTMVAPTIIVCAIGCFVISRLLPRPA